MTDLVEFLRARYAEDEQAALAGRDNYIAWLMFLNDKGEVRYTTAGAIAEGTAHVPAGAKVTPENPGVYAPARVLCEVDANRRTVELHGDQHECTDTRGSEYPYVGCETLRLRALPYADHPDYRQEWAPERA